MSQTGLEISNGGFRLQYTTADTFDPTPLQIRKSNGIWYSGLWTSSWIDWPCATYSVPNCMNGAFYGSNHWADNKPS